MHFIGYIVIGISAAIVTRKLAGGNWGLFAYSLTGVVGGLLGGWAFGFLDTSIAGSLFFSTAGAVLAVRGLSSIKNPLSDSSDSPLSLFPEQDC